MISINLMEVPVWTWLFDPTFPSNRLWCCLILSLIELNSSVFLLSLFLIPNPYQLLLLNVFLSLLKLLISFQDLQVSIEHLVNLFMWWLISFGLVSVIVLLFPSVLWFHSILFYFHQFIFVFLCWCSLLIITQFLISFHHLLTFCNYSHLFRSFFLNHLFIFLFSQFFLLLT